MSPDIDELLDRATLDEQISLLAGANFWETVAIDRLGIPAMRVTDGPVGARGTERKCLWHPTVIVEGRHDNFPVAEVAPTTTWRGDELWIVGDTFQELVGGISVGDYPRRVRAS